MNFDELMRKIEQRTATKEDVELAARNALKTRSERQLALAVQGINFARNRLNIRIDRSLIDEVSAAYTQTEYYKRILEMAEGDEPVILDLPKE